MKRHAIAVSTAVALGALLAASGVSAIPTDSLRGDVDSAVGSGGRVNVAIDGGTVTLTGHVDGPMTAQAVRRAVRGHAEVDEVIDLILRD